MEGPDHQLSADPVLFQNMINEIRRIKLVLGSGIIKLQECEQDTLQYRRSS